MTSPLTHYATSSDGAQIAWTATGVGSPLLRTPAIFGNIANANDREAAEDLSQRLGMTIVSYDRRGNAASTRDAEMNLDLLIDDIASIADDLGSETIALWGRMAGSFEAIGFASRYPSRVDHAVLNDPIPSGADWLAEPDTAGWVGALHGDWEFFTEAFCQSTVGWGEPGGPSLAAWMRTGTDERAFKALVAAYTSADMVTLGGRVTAPTLVVQQNSLRPAAWAQSVAHAIPDAALLSVPTARLGRSTDFDDEVMTLIREFLQPEQSRPSEAAAVAGQFRAILFTDVVASTPLLAQLKDARMRDVMRDHDTVLQAAVDDHGGRVIKTIGDAFMAEFAVPSAAVDCAIAMQRGIQAQFADSDVPIRLRIGINAGEPIAEDDDLHGISVKIAKRLESAAATNGILVSDVVKAAVAGKDFEFTDQGEVSLKGLEEPVRAWSVEWVRTHGQDRQ